MVRFLHKRWFLVALVVLTAGGLLLGFWHAGAADGAAVPKDNAGTVGEFLRSLLPRFPRISTTIVLFLMAYTLESRHLRAAMRSPRPVLWAGLVNFGLVPLLAWPLMSMQRIPDFRIGLMIAASVPCTMAAASVWTRKARGNDAVSLMVTLLTNGLCFAVTPFWLKLTTGTGVEFDMGRMVFQLALVVLVPTAAGQALRLVPRAAAFADRHKTPLGVAAQSLILSLVFLAAVEAGGQLASNGGPPPGWGAAGLVWGCCIAVHIAAMFVAAGGASLLRIAPADVPAVIFAGSQKTLPIGVLLATDPAMFGNPDLLGPGMGVPFAVFPMLMFHVSQLFIDTPVADRMAERNAVNAASSGPG